MKQNDTKVTDVVAQIKHIIENFDPRLTVEERNLISVAYKNRTNNLRSSWRIVDTLEKMEASSATPSQRVGLIRSQREKIEQELADICLDIVHLLDRRLLPAATAGDDEERVFYAKMKGDYYRYLAEFAQKKDRDRYAEESLLAYKHAYKDATATLEALHPTRLGLALNFSVFFHDVRKSPERACHLAKSALDDAVRAIVTLALESTSIRDSLMILQLLKDDLILWAQEIQTDTA